MTTVLHNHPATGGPGIEPRWTRSDKDGVGTAYSALSRVWFTVSKGILNEVYYPTIDRPQVRDLQYLVTDGETFCNDERRMHNVHEWLAPHALGYRITNTDPRKRYRIIKEVISDPHQACVLMHTRLEADPAILETLRLFALLAPHLEGIAVMPTFHPAYLLRNYNPATRGLVWSDLQKVMAELGLSLPRRGGK